MIAINHNIAPTNHVVIPTERNTHLEHKQTAGSWNFLYTIVLIVFSAIASRHLATDVSNSRFVTQFWRCSYQTFPLPSSYLAFGQFPRRDTLQENNDTEDDSITITMVKMVSTKKGNRLIEKLAFSNETDFENSVLHFANQKLKTKKNGSDGGFISRRNMFLRSRMR